jgi:hypothetical protein
MSRLFRYRIAAAAAVLTAAQLAAATPLHNVCVPNALGVPTRNNEPPKWVAWTGAPGVLSTPAEALDDPRWQGASGESFAAGAAKSPLGLRTLWSHQDQDYLYMSFVMDVEGMTGLPGTGSETPRDLFLGFQRSSVLDPTPGSPGDEEHGYVFQFHLTKGSSGTLVEPVHCNRALDSSVGAGDGCAEAGGANSNPKNYWRVYADFGETGATCGSTTAAHFAAITAGDTKAPWVATKQAVRFWKLSTANRWAILLRIPLTDPGHPLSDGIDRNSTFWYQGTVQTNADDYVNLGYWPRELTSSVCVSLPAGGFLDHGELDNPDHYSRITEVATPGAAGCDGGLAIDVSRIGSIADYAGTPAGLDTHSLSGAWQFKALHADNSRVTNTIVAQVRNTSGASISTPLSARFRLAMWGSAPWSMPVPDGKWTDMRSTRPTTAGQQPGICLGSADPNAADTCSPPVAIAAGGQKAIWFNWTLGTDATLGESEYCQFGLKPPGAVGSGCDNTCSCASAGAHCDPGDTTGTKSTVSAGQPCVSKYYEHQCLLVELSSPMGGVTFAQQSAWNNMQFAQLSVTAQEALIDARALPTAPGQKEQNIYLIAMPRNMGQNLGGAIDGTKLIRQNALNRAEAVAAPYLQDISQNPGLAKSVAHNRASNQIAALSAAAARKNDDGPADKDPPDTEKRVAKVAAALQVMPDGDLQRTLGLLQVAVNRKATAAELNQNLVSTIGADQASEVLPTLEIYPYYQPRGQGHAFQPMTAFTVFLSHEGTMTGMNWVIDGATRIGHNIYQLKIPVGFAKKIQVRAEAIEGGGQLGPANPAWPCAGGCPGCGGGAKNCGLVSVIGNTGPGLIAGVLVIARRKRRKPAAKP